MLGRKTLGELETLVNPDTLMRWYSELVLSKWDYSQRRGPGPPRVMKDSVNLCCAHGARQSLLGLHRNQGALANLGHHVGCGTIANIFKEHGIEPAPKRRKHTSWSTFLKAHWQCLAATDFLTVEVWTLTELATHYVLFFIDIATRSVYIAGIATIATRLRRRGYEFVFVICRPAISATASRWAMGCWNFEFTSVRGIASIVVGAEKGS